MNINTTGLFRFLISSLLLLCLVVLSSCARIPEGVQPITGIDAQRYIGKWYEIARLDNRFERGLTQVTATYQLRENGDITVINRGYDAAKKEWKQAEGVAKFTKTPDTGHLKVSFFRPFYGGYTIIALDKTNYRYSMVAGNDRSYLWILSRTPTLADDILQPLITQAKQLDFPVDQLIMVAQQP